MAITYHAGRRIQGISTDTAQTLTTEIDLSTNSGWTFTGSNMSVDTTNEYLQGSSSTNDDRGTKSLGITLSDTKFVVRQKMVLTDVTTGGNGQLYFGYTDKDNSTTVLGNRDGIGITIRTGADFLHSYALNQAWQSAETLTTTPTETTYYLEIIRSSPTEMTMKLFDNENYSGTATETVTNTISSSINGLDHITIGGWDNGATGNITGRFSDIKIYNGVSSLTSKPVNVQLQSRFEETDTRKIYYKANLRDEGSWLLLGTVFNGRGVFGGGLSPSYPNQNKQNSMEYITIPILGNSIDFGDLTSAKAWLAATGTQKTGLFAGGDNGSALNVIDQFTFDTLGNCTDFGDLSSVRTYFGATSDNTYAVFAGGNNSKQTIDYVTVASGGNTTGYTGFTFDRTTAVGYDSPTKAFFSSGAGATAYNNFIETVVFGTWGTVADFGDLTLGRDYASGCSSDTRGIIGGGFTPANSYAPVNNIDYTTMDTPGNATDFGDLSAPRYELDSVSDGTRGIFYSGVTTGDSHTNIIDYITIATTGNATDFGDALTTRDSFAGCSNK